MNRQNLPLLSDIQPDMLSQVTEIRMPTRTGKHDMRNEREARP